MAVPQALPQPGGDDGAVKSISNIWLLTIAILGLIVLVFGVLSYLQLRDNKTADALIGLATGALGALVGLLAPSPAAK